MPFDVQARIISAILSLNDKDLQQVGRKLREIAHPTVQAITSPEMFLTLGNMLGQAFLCTPEDPDCNTSLAIKLAGLTYLLFELSQLILTLCWSKASDNERVKKTLQSILTGLKTYGRSIQSNFLFIFLVMMRVAGEVSVVMNEGNPEKQGEISNLIFGLIIGLAAGIATISSKEVLDKMLEIGVEKKWIEPTVKEVFVKGKLRSNAGRTIGFFSTSSFLAAIPAAAQIRFGTDVYEILYQALAGKLLDTTMERCMRWGPLLATYGVVSVFNGIRNVSGNSDKLDKVANLGTLSISLFLLLPLFLDTADYFMVYPWLTILLMSTSFGMRILEYMLSPSPLNEEQTDRECSGGQMRFLDYMLCLPSSNEEQAVTVDPTEDYTPINSP